MRIGIVGANGMLGFQLAKYLVEQHDIKTFAFCRTQRNTNEFSKNFKKIEINFFNDYFNYDFTKHLLDLNLDFLVNCVGVTKQKEDKSSPADIIKINSLLPLHLSNILSNQKCRLIQISTDCVFNGIKGNFSEQSSDFATDLYGTTKRLGELIDKRHIVIRTSIIGHELNEKKSLLEWFINTKEKIYGYKNALFSGLTTYELSKIIYKHVIKGDISGLYNVAGPKIDKNCLLNKINKIYNLNKEIIESKKVKIDRSLDSSLFLDVSGYQQISWSKMILEAKNNWVEYNV